MKVIVLLLICLVTFFNVKAQQNTDETLAYQYYQQGEYINAIPLLEKLFSDTRSDSHFDLLIDALIKIKNYQQAEQIIRKLIKQQPKKLPYQIALGRTFQERGRTAEANGIYEIAIQSVANNEFQLRELANNFYRFGAYDLAISAFLKGREVLKDEQVFAFELLNIYRFKKDKPQLINEYLNALSTYPQLLLQAQSTLASLFEGNDDYAQLESALLKKIQKSPQAEIYTDLLVWQYLQQGEYELALRQLLAKDKRTNNVALQLYEAANTFAANKAFATAIKAYTYLLAKGPENEWYVPAKLQLINAKYELAIAGKIDQVAIKLLSNELAQIIAQYGITTETLFALQKLAYLQAYRLNNLPAAEATLEQALKVQGISATNAAQLKLELGDIYVLNNQPWEAVLIYEQVAKGYENKPVGSEARYRTARLSFYQGNFKYAKAQADVLKASTSQLIANDALNLSLLISDNLQNKNDSLALMMYASAEMLEFLNKDDAALLKLDSIDAAFPGNSLTDDILLAQAKIFIKNNNFPTAASHLKELISKHTMSIWIDDAIYMLANLYEVKLVNLSEAKRLYQQLIAEYPGSMLSAEARKRYRNLRGDNIGS